MNEFISLRKSFLEYQNPSAFSLAYLKKYRAHDYFNSSNESFLFDKVERIIKRSLQSEIQEDDIIEALQNIGDNDYLDSLILNLVIANFHVMHENLFKQILLVLLGEGNKNASMTYSLIDICIECEMNILKRENLKALIKKYKKNNDIVSILVDYIYHFKIDSLKDELYELMDSSLPDNIKIQIVELLVELYSIEELEQTALKEIIEGKRMYVDYKKILRNEMNYDEEGLVLIQVMFQGSFDSEGKGNNGGIAVLHKNLGK